MAKIEVESGAQPQVYRVYREGTKEDYLYKFSIVASNTLCEYVIPEGNSKLRNTFDSSRINDAAANQFKNGTPYPTTPEGWARLAAYNSGHGDGLFLVENEYINPDFDKAVTNEKEDYANRMWEAHGHLYDRAKLEDSKFKIREERLSGKNDGS
jgi:uncharacterized C2H2 Zn-finger protein